MNFDVAETEQDFINVVRALYRAYMPESDAWAKPNLFDINSIMMGGLAFSAVNEARNSIDVRLNPQTAQGEYLDVIAAMPPLNLSRLPAQKAQGTVLSPCGLTAGEILTAADGTEFEVLSTGNGQVPVQSVEAGDGNNSLVDQRLTGSSCEVRSEGIFGASDIESDDQFRRRIFAARAQSVFFGSVCSLVEQTLGVPNVTRAWESQDPENLGIVFVMEDKYPCGNPTNADVTAVEQHFDAACLTTFCCPQFLPGCSKTIAPDVTWTTAPPDICAVRDALQAYLRANVGPGEGVTQWMLQQWLDNNYPELGGSAKNCCDFDGEPDCVINCVELEGC